LRRINPSILAVLAMIAVLLLVGFVFSDRFRTVTNLKNIYEQSATLCFVALGQTVVILTGGIDLSFDGHVALTSTLMSGLIDSKPERVLPVVAGILALGVAIGVVNGLLILLLRVHPLIITLGTGAALQGCAFLYSLMPVGGVPDGFDFFAFGKIGGMPFGTSLAILAFALVGGILHFTRLGRQIYAFGGDQNATKLVGISTNRIVLFVYGLSGLMVAITAVHSVSRLGVGNPVATDQGLNLASITPVVVGGTMLTGGRGGVLGTLLGVFMVQLLNNLLNFMDVSTFYQWMIQGMIVIIAVSSYVERRRGFA